jgi:hypothetical protein
MNTGGGKRESSFHALFGMLHIKQCFAPSHILYSKTRIVIYQTLIIVRRFRKRKSISSSIGTGEKWTL